MRLIKIANVVLIFVFTKVVNAQLVSKEINFGVTNAINTTPANWNQIENILQLTYIDSQRIVTKTLPYLQVYSIPIEKLGKSENFVVNVKFNVSKFRQEPFVYICARESNIILNGVHKDSLTKRVELNNFVDTVSVKDCKNKNNLEILIFIGFENPVLTNLNYSICISSLNTEKMNQNKRIKSIGFFKPQLTKQKNIDESSSYNRYGKADGIAPYDGSNFGDIKNSDNPRDEDGKFTVIKPMENPSTPPVYLKGGDSGFYQFLSDYLSGQYPKKCLEKNIEHRLILRFVVSKKGLISDIIILNPNPKCPEFNELAKRVLIAAGKWKPGKNEKGEDVASKRNITINFSLGE